MSIKFYTRPALHGRYYGFTIRLLSKQLDGFILIGGRAGIIRRTHY